MTITTHSPHSPEPLGLVTAELDGALGLVHRIADDLDRARRSADRRVDTLLDGGWSGDAASAYAEDWQRWRSGSAEVLDGLHAMAATMREVRVGLLGQDDDVALAFRALGPTS